MYVHVTCSRGGLREGEVVAPQWMQCDGGGDYMTGWWWWWRTDWGEVVGGEQRTQGHGSSGEGRR